MKKRLISEIDNSLGIRASGVLLSRGDHGKLPVGGNQRYRVEVGFRGFHVRLVSVSFGGAGDTYPPLLRQAEARGAECGQESNSWEAVAIPSLPQCRAGS